MQPRVTMDDLMRQKQAKQVQADQANSSLAMQKALFESFHAMLSAFMKDTTKADAISIVAKALDTLDSKIGDHQTELGTLKSGLQVLEKELKAIPADSLKQLPKFLQQKDAVKVTNLNELEKGFTAIEKAVKALKLSVDAPQVKVAAPNVTVPAPVVNLPAPNLQPLLRPLEDLLNAFKGFKIPEAKPVDNSGVEKLLKSMDNRLKDLPDQMPSFSGGGGGRATPYEDVSGNPAFVSLGQTTAANSMPVVLASDKNVQLGAVDVNGNQTSVRTDNFGRLKISHGQPAPTAVTLDAVASQIAIASDGFSDAIFTFVPLGSHIITFEYSPDSTDGSNGNWFSALASNQGANAAAAITATITTLNVSYRVSAPAASWMRARVSTQTTPGSIAAQAITTTAAAQPQVTATLSSAAVTMTSTTIAAPAATIAGLTIGKVLSAATTNATSQKASAGRLIGWCLSNTTASYKYFKFFNKASAPTVGTDTPVFTIPIPPNSAAAFSQTQPVTFATGVAYAITGAFADNDTTAVAAGDVIGALFYV